MSTNQTKNETTNGTTLRGAAERWGMDPDGLTIEQAFALGRVAGIREEADARPITEERLTHPRRINAAASDLIAGRGGETAPEGVLEPAAGVPLAEQTPEQQEAAVDRLAVAEAMLEEMDAEAPATLWSESSRRQRLEVARQVEDPEGALIDARKAVMWLELVRTDLPRAQPETYCDDAEEGFAAILGMIRARLELADRTFKGSYNRSTD